MIVYNCLGILKTLLYKCFQTNYKCVISSLLIFCAQKFFYYKSYRDFKCFVHICLFVLNTLRCVCKWLIVFPLLKCLFFGQFIDLGILLGCDYCDSIRGVGPKRAMELIQKHRNIETIIENIDTKKFPVSDDWLYKEARELFVNPEVAECEKLEVSSWS